MPDATLRPDSSTLEGEPGQDADLCEDCPEDEEMDQDQLTHLLLTAWTMVLEEEQRKR